jgi:hypothetical protein
MLVICHDAWIPNMMPFVNHKNAIGIPTSIVGVSTIGNNATAIKNYIQSVYSSSDLAFVLLVGDAAQVVPGYSSGDSDAFYSKLVGGDDYPELMVGRFSAESPADVDTQVERSIEYEQNAATLQPWFWKGIGVASSQGAGIGDEGQADNVHMAEIRTWLLGAGYTHVDEIYDPSGTAAQVSAALNDGRGVVNYCGHGSTTSWGTTGFNNADINALVNDNMLPWVHTVACVNGNFDGYTCFAEAWTRATHNGEPTGAVAVYASTINQSWAPPMEAQDETNLLLTDVNEPYHTLGTLCYAGSCSMMDDYGSDGVEMFDTWVFFGDPSLRVIGTVAPPTGLGVTPGMGLNSAGPVGGPFTPDTIDYTLENHDAAPLDYLVTAGEVWVTVANGSGTLPPGGTAVVTVSLNQNAKALASGPHADSVTFVNLTNHDGDTARAVTLDVGVPQPVYQWPLDLDPGFTTAGEWAFGQPQGLGGSSHGNPDPASGATGNNVYGVNLWGDYATTVGGPYYLTLGPVDLTGVNDVLLQFQRWLNSDYQPYVSATVEVSTDGVVWTEIFSNGTNEVADGSWTPQQFDLSSLASNEPSVSVRWGYEVGQSYAWAYSGWNIDDIALWGTVAGQVQAGACCYPDGSCVVEFEVDCTGVFQGAGVMCDPDPCQQGTWCLGDSDCSGACDFGDVDYFIEALTGEAAWEQYHMTHQGGMPSCPFAVNDLDGGGVTFADIAPFVDHLGAPCEVYRAPVSTRSAR